MKIPSIDRARDEVILKWLRLRDKGWSLSRIAAVYGTTKSAVGITLNRIDRESAE